MVINAELKMASNKISNVNFPSNRTFSISKFTDVSTAAGMNKQSVVPIPTPPKLAGHQISDSTTPSITLEELKALNGTIDQRERSTRLKRIVRSGGTSDVAISLFTPIQKSLSREIQMRKAARLLSKYRKTLSK